MSQRAGLTLFSPAAYGGQPIRAKAGLKGSCSKMHDETNKACTEMKISHSGRNTRFLFSFFRASTLLHLKGKNFKCFMCSDFWIPNRWSVMFWLTLNFTLVSSAVTVCQFFQIQHPKCVVMWLAASNPTRRCNKMLPTHECTTSNQLNSLCLI